MPDMRQHVSGSQTSLTHMGREPGCWHEAGQTALPLHLAAGAGPNLDEYGHGMRLGMQHEMSMQQQLVKLKLKQSLTSSSWLCLIELHQSAVRFRSDYIAAMPQRGADFCATACAGPDWCPAPFSGSNRCSLSTACHRWMLQSALAVTWVTEHRLVRGKALRLDSKMGPSIQLANAEGCPSAWHVWANDHVDKLL